MNDSLSDGTKILNVRFAVMKILKLWIQGFLKVAIVFVAADGVSRVISALLPMKWLSYACLNWLNLMAAERSLMKIKSELAFRVRSIGDR